MDTQILVKLAQEQTKALEEFARVANAIIDQTVKTQETVIEVMQTQKDILLNKWLNWKPKTSRCTCAPACSATTA